jgi:peptidoglycan/xylan/chitin deacetylase (PgdA/CDA1 family)
MLINKFVAGVLCTFTSAIVLSACKNTGAKAGGDKDSSAIAAQKQGTPIPLNPNKKYIFLTWDDSPQPPGTLTCERIFREEGVKATFFAVGMHMFDPFRKRIVDTLRNSYPQFLLGNHSHSHGFRDHYKTYYAHPDSAVQDMLLGAQELGTQVKIARLPGMNAWVTHGKIQAPHSSLAVCKLMDSIGYCTIGWDVEWQFGKKSTPIQTPQQMADEVSRKFDDGTTYAQNAIVVLAHDRMFAQPQYADSLRKFITLLKQDSSYVFETVDHYPLVQSK